MAKIQPVKAGDVISEGLLNRIVDQFERFANLKSNSPYIRLWSGPYGKSIALALPQQTWALLSGSSSPYSFTEVRDGPGGTWVSMPNGDSGTSNVYEVNNVPNLGGKIVPIQWTSAGDWRTQYVGFGPPPCNASPFCLNDIPDTIYVGDDLGTNPMTRVHPTDITQGWQTAILNYPTTTYEFDSGTSGPCHVTGDTGTVRYTFSVTCLTIGPDAGKLRATLKKLFWGRCCDLPPSTSQAGIGPPIIDRDLATATALFECGATGVDIAFPTSIAICPPSTSAMAMPGGGGIISVTF